MFPIEGAETKVLQLQLIKIEYLCFYIYVIYFILMNN